MRKRKEIRESEADCSINYILYYKNTILSYMFVCVSFDSTYDVPKCLCVCVCVRLLFILCGCTGFTDEICENVLLCTCMCVHLYKKEKRCVRLCAVRIIHDMSVKPCKYIPVYHIKLILLNIRYCTRKAKIKF